MCLLNIRILLLTYEEGLSNIMELENRKPTQKTPESEDAMPSRHTSVLLPRLILGTIIITAILFPSLYQPYLSSLYDRLYNSSFYRFSAFETIETTFFYIFFEVIYNIKFMRNPGRRIDIRSKSRTTDAGGPTLPKLRYPSERLLEAVTYIVPLLALDFTMIKKYAGVPVADIRLSGGYPVANTNDTTGDISSSFLLPTIHKVSLQSPLQLNRALPPLPPSSRRLVLELIIAFFIYDTIFFFVHLAFHRLPFLRQIHKPHHRHEEINPQVTNQLSIVERLSLILCANFSLNIIGSHVLTRTAFVPIFVYLLIEVHCGMDLDWSYDKVMPPGWGAGSRKHAAHHREGHGNYQAFFCWWDDGFEALRKKGWVQ